jgi:hypothetical protein
MATLTLKVADGSTCSGVTGFAKGSKDLLAGCSDGASAAGHLQYSAGG